MTGPGTPPEVATEGWEQLARAAAAEPGAEASGPGLQPLLCLSLDGSVYAIAVERVREIVRPRPITPIPRVRRDVVGAMSLRGDIIQVIDLRMRLGLDSAEETPASRIVVVECGNSQATGLLVDGVREVLHAPSQTVEPATGAEHQGVVSGLCVQGEEFVSVVDLDRLLEAEVVDA